MPATNWWLAVSAPCQLIRRVEDKAARVQHQGCTMEVLIFHLKDSPTILGDQFLPCEVHWAKPRHRAGAPCFKAWRKTNSRFLNFWAASSHSRTNATYSVRSRDPWFYLKSLRLFPSGPGGSRALRPPRASLPARAKPWDALPIVSPLN